MSNMEKAIIVETQFNNIQQGLIIWLLIFSEELMSVSALVVTMLPWDKLGRVEIWIAATVTGIAAIVTIFLTLIEKVQKLSMRIGNFDLLF